MADLDPFIHTRPVYAFSRCQPSGSSWSDNLESVLTYEGTSEVHQLTIGKALTGVAAFR